MGTTAAAPHAQNESLGASPHLQIAITIDDLIAALPESERLTGSSELEYTDVHGLGA